MSRRRRVLLIVIAVAVLGIVGYGFYFVKIVNPRVAEELLSDPQGERAGIVMLMTFKGKTIPVNYLHEGDKVFAGADFGWWKAFRPPGTPAELLIRGVTHQAHGTVVLDDPAYVADVFSRLRPTVPKWLPDALNGKLVVFQLESAP